MGDEKKMSEEKEKGRIPVTDKRRSSSTRRRPEEVEVAAPEQETAVAAGEELERDYLDDLRRVQAEFENWKKRSIKERTAVIERANARLLERLLPVLDNFERALAHAEDDPGIELLYKDFRKTLEDEGLEEIEADRVPFDPNVHEAVQTVEDENVDGDVVSSVYRRGYRFKGRVLRPVMVVVARPPQPDESDQAAEG
jgi:molecular chaperone GrpE